MSGAMRAFLLSAIVIALATVSPEVPADQSSQVVTLTPDRMIHYDTPPHFREAVRLLSEGKVKTGLLIRGETALAELPAFFAANAERSIPKAVVRP